MPVFDADLEQDIDYHKESIEPNLKKTQKSEVLKELYFQPKRTTEILISLHKRGISIGAKSCTNRLTDLQKEGLIKGIFYGESKEKLWLMVRTYKNGQQQLI